MLESPASCFAFRYGASLNMTGMTCLRLLQIDLETIFLPDATVCLSRTGCEGRSRRRRIGLPRSFGRDSSDRAATLHSDSGRHRRRWTSRCGSKWRRVQAGYAEPENSSWAIAYFYRATRPLVESGNDTRRRIVDPGEASQTAACA